LDYAYQQYQMFRLVQESVNKKKKEEGDDMDDFVETVVCMKGDCKHRKGCRLYDLWIGEFMPKVVKKSTGMGWKWTCKSFEKEE